MVSDVATQQPIEVFSPFVHEVAHASFTQDGGFSEKATDVGTPQNVALSIV